MKSAFIFGDVHGQADQLALLLQEMKQRDPCAPIYSVGDLLDRGPDSKGVIELCVQANVQAVLGNHECWMQEFLNGRGLDRDLVSSKMMASIQTLTSYELQIEMSDSSLEWTARSTIPATHRAYIQRLPLWRAFEIGGRDVMIVHAGIPQDGPTRLMAALSDELGHDTIPPLSQIVDVLLRAHPNWKDALLWATTHTMKQYRHPNTILCHGHYPYNSVGVSHDATINSTVFSLDTGCGTARSRTLSAVHLQDLQELQEPERPAGSRIRATIFGITPIAHPGGGLKLCMGESRDL